MKRIVSILAAALTSLAILAPISANASIIGLYHHWAGNDKISLAMKDGKPVLKIEYSNFPAIEECPGFQLYRTAPPTGELAIRERDGLRGTGFQLWEARNWCLTTQWTMQKNGAVIPRKNLVQEIDLFEGFFGLYTNKDELIRGFQAGEFVLAVGYQAKQQPSSADSSMMEELFTYQDAVNGKELIGTSR